MPHPLSLQNAAFARIISFPWMAAMNAGAQQCSTRTTEGRYLVICDGYLSPAPKAPLVPAKLLSVATADEKGTFRAANGKFSFGGNIFVQAVVGTEVLNSDCTGTITYAQTLDGQPGPPLDIAFVVSEHGSKIDGLSTDPGSVFSCHLTRIGEDWP